MTDLEEFRRDKHLLEALRGRYISQEKRPKEKFRNMNGLSPIMR